MFCTSYQKTKNIFFVVCFPALLKCSTVQNAYTYNTGNTFIRNVQELVKCGKLIVCVVGTGIWGGGDLTRNGPTMQFVNFQKKIKGIVANLGTL